MLKIKDNVDLKELEKFGFVHWEHTYWDNVHVEYWRLPLKSEDTLEINVKDRSIYMWFDECFDKDRIEETLFDLIQAGLVEKVSE